MVPSDKAIDDCAVRAEGVQGRLLILSHEATIAIDVGAQDGCELSLQYSPLAGEGLKPENGLQLRYVSDRGARGRSSYRLTL
jgi:hypothetical protein